MASERPTFDDILGSFGPGDDFSDGTSSVVSSDIDSTFNKVEREIMDPASDEYELAIGTPRRDAPLFVDPSQSVDGDDVRNQPDEGELAQGFGQNANSEDLGDDENDWIDEDHDEESDQIDTDGEEPLAEFKHWEANYLQSVGDDINTAEADTEFLARQKELRRRLLKKERDVTLNRQEEEFLMSGQLYVEHERIQRAKHDYWSWRSQMDAEKDRPKKKELATQFPNPKKDNSSTQKGNPKKRASIASHISSKKRKITFDISNYLGPGLQSYYSKGMKKSTLIHEGYCMKEMKDCIPEVRSFGVTNLLPGCEEAIDATSTPSSSADQHTALLKQQPIFKYMLRPVSMSKPSSKLKEMVSSIVASNTNSRTPETSMGDEQKIKRARRHFSKNNKPKGKPTGEGSDNLWLSPRMKTALRDHQLIGVGWMRRRETSGEMPHGGLIADDMGLGKTVQMIANIMDGRPSKEALQQGMKSTLVVLPPGLVKQWMLELQKHAMTPGRVLVYNKQLKNSSNCALEQLKEADIILTTYDEVRLSYPSSKSIPPKLKGGARDAWWKNNWEKKRGLLYQIHFWRIVLDEAQAIKNPNSETSVACRALRGNHRWLLTGTPLTDSVEEVYPYFKFLRIPFTGDLATFKHNYIKVGSQVHLQRLRHMLQTYMFRRTRHDKLLGRSIQKLPHASEKDLWIEYEGPEKVVYEAILHRYNAEIQAYADGKSDLKPATGLRLVGNLRRALSHPLLVQEEFETFDEQTLENIKKAYARQAEGQAYPKNIRAMQQQLFGQAIDSDQLKGGKFGRKMSLKRYFDALGIDQEQNRLKREILCSGCRIVPTKPQVNHCNHAYCNKCATRAKLTAASSKMDVECSEPKCDSFLDDFHVATEEEMATLARSSMGKSTRTSGAKTEKERWMTITAQVDGVVPSAKTLAVKVQVLRWLAGNPKCKIIVFTLYPDMVKLLKKICEIEGWKSCEIHGKVSPRRRVKVLEAFQNDNNIRILLATLGTGGVGLNLTAASRVLIMDPWWNAAMEQQAICRVWRMGQTARTEFVRLRIRQTVDERVLGKQVLKSEQIDKLMKQQNELHLKATELLSLFGKRYDGSSFIVQDDTEVPSKYLPDQTALDEARDECNRSNSSDE